MRQQTVTINGTTYDKHTGMPIRASSVNTAASPADARSIHRHIQKSTTLQRKYVSQNRTPKVVAAPAKAAEPIRERSPMIQKYAKQPVKTIRPVVPAKTRGMISDFGPTVHPVAKKAVAQQATAPLQSAQKPATSMPKPSDVIKAEATQKALESAPSHNKRQRVRREKRPKNRFANFMSWASAGTALLLIAGYFTYVNMPNLSVRVAAAQAGVEASYPNYRPSGYSLSGKIAYDDGQVSMKFASNGTPQSFVLKQTNSAWDSSAVLENYVQPLAGEDYTTSTEGGLTVYTFNGSNAAWVNGGVLYTIEGDAALSTDQVRQIAVSM